MKKRQDIIIRQMEPKDFAKVAKLENKNWTSYETPAIIDSSVERYIDEIQSGIRYFLAVEETSDEIFAVLVLFDKHRNLSTNHKVLTFSPMVIKSARGQGLGKFLLEFILDYAKDEGYHKISISVLSTNKVAINIYESANFVIEGIEHKEFFLNDIWVDNIIYAYFLKEN
ncbi:MAG: GNAT family N-acetyltransferase [Lactovum sp.]